ncbi:MAG: hypothetical protein EHM21_13735, partial [Chloroflexi bacterium]
GWWGIRVNAGAPREAPEAEKILALQAQMPFQLLIPAYLPASYDRKNMEISITETGPSGEPMVQMTYYSPDGPPLFIREWIPVNPDMEILAGSRPVETKWGKGWMLKQDLDLLVLWVSIGPMRASIYTPDQTLIDKEHLLAIGESLGPASNRQVFSFVVNPPSIKEAQPPPPVEIETNAEGVQEVVLVITPGGYSPLRFAVKKGVPVRLIFRQLGQVGCGNELNFPTTPGEYASLRLDTPSESEVLEFTPEAVGVFEFYGGHVMFKGEMYVNEDGSGGYPAGHPAGRMRLARRGGRCRCVPKPERHQPGRVGGHRSHC